MAHPVRELLVTLLRAAFRRLHDLRAALGAVVLAGAVVAVLAVWAFVALVELVQEGDTQRFDEAALEAIDRLHAPWLDPLMLEVTALGNVGVVFVTTGVAATFLWLTRHRYSAYLLGVSTAGGVLVSFVLKSIFARPRPEVVEWSTHVSTSSFPSGHATAAAVVYLTVGYLVARLQRRRWVRAVTMALAALLVVLIAFSRLALGVHYPSDVAAGMTVGLAWAAFCMTTLESIQRFIMRDAPEERAQEEPSPEDEADELRERVAGREAIAGP